MAGSGKAKVTPKLQRALAELKKAVAKLPAGTAKNKAVTSLTQLTRSLKGPAATRVVRRCPANTNIIRI